jgi:hypothetical protein
MGITDRVAMPTTTSQLLVCGATAITHFFNSCGNVPTNFHPNTLSHIFQNSLNILGKLIL